MTIGCIRIRSASEDLHLLTNFLELALSYFAADLHTCYMPLDSVLSG
jgi:hypothetical protein